MYRLHTPVAEVAQALLIVMRRGSLRAAEEITGHRYETIGEWLRRASEHAEALTTILTQDLHLSPVEIDEFWSFVRKKTGLPTKPMGANAGDAWCSDGWRGYAAILRRASRQSVRLGKLERPRLVVPPDVCLTQTIKHRDEHGKLLSIEIRAAMARSGPCTGHRPHRARQRHLARLDQCSDSQDPCFCQTGCQPSMPWSTCNPFPHNWIRPHRALRLPMPSGLRRYQPRTPAMALGLTDHPWSWITFLTTSSHTTSQ